MGKLRVETCEPTDDPMLCFRIGELVPCWTGQLDHERPELIVAQVATSLPKRESGSEQ